MTKRAPDASDVSVSPPRRRSKYTLAPLVLISGNVVLFALFFVWPAVIGLVYSFTNYTGVGAFQFVGLDNYQKLLGDSTFYSATTRTLLYTVLFVPLNFVLSLLIANVLVSKHAKGTSVARIFFFIPWLLSPIIVGVLWRWLFGENFGLVNYFIEKVGGSAVPGSRTRTCHCSWSWWRRPGPGRASPCCCSSRRSRTYRRRTTRRRRSTAPVRGASSSASPCRASLPRPSSSSCSTRSTR